ncbi:hypothetical protein D3C87_1420420 [compost metagenome]
MSDGGRQVVAQVFEALQVARELFAEFGPELTGQEGVPPFAQASLELRAPLRGDSFRCLPGVHGQQSCQFELRVQCTAVLLQLGALRRHVRRFLGPVGGRAQLAQPGRHAGQLGGQGFGRRVGLGLDVQRVPALLDQRGVIRLVDDPLADVVDLLARGRQYRVDVGGRSGRRREGGH